MKIKNPGSTSLMAAATILGLLTLSESALAQPPCERTIKANVVALDQAYYNNRIGAFQAGGMIFALRRDVVSSDPATKDLKPGKVMLRPDKRPRPIVLRANAGDCLQISFQNLLHYVPGPPKKGPAVFNPAAPNQAYPEQVGGPGYTPNENVLMPQPPPPPPPGFPFQGLASQPATRLAGVHVMGLELIKAQAPGLIAGVSADGSWVGGNDVAPIDAHTRASGLVGSGESITYTLYAKSVGSYLLYSTAANVGTQLGFGGQLMQGLFGSVTVQPRTAEWYRSQVTKVDLDLAKDGTTADGHPILTSASYFKVYPPAHPKAGQPILRMLDSNNEIVYTDLTAIVTGPRAGRFRCADCPSGNCQNCPDLRNNPSYPNQTEPYREFAIHYHDDFVSTQAFEEFRKHDNPDQDSQMTYTLQGSRDFFAINYGMAGIGPEVWSNRIGVGPMHQCATCRFEEFFLSSWAVGDPAMVVDFPANSVDAGGAIKKGPKATKAFYPDDPSNVYHSYMGDHVKFQILHAGTNITHVHHLHAHQWLHSPNNDTSSYRDSQMISPGGSYTLEHTFNGSGNKNKTVGDSIFHCHFYPHFAQGMWSLWRVHDVFEGGTELDPATGKPTTGWNRALPDGEIATGTPIPAIVPMPTLPMAPIPSRVQIVPVTVDGTTAGYQAQTEVGGANEANGPGYPFFIPGVAGQRVPHPPLDFAPDEAGPPGSLLDGGLPRFIALKEAGTIYEKHNRWDFTKFNDKLKAVELPEAGTPIEQIAMKYHAKRHHDTFLPDGAAANGPNGFVLNGLPPISGAPYADPAIELDGTPVCPGNAPACLRRYKAADIQLDLVFNKKGQHYPQSRIITLWGDVKDTIAKTRAPEPFFFRANSKQVIEYWLANLVPNYYELDDFQVRTPTDIIGQHIHLVKFDVTSSDGSANGFNYEDGTLSPDEVRELIHNINDGGGLFQSFAFNAATAKNLTAKPIPFFGNGGAGDPWLGAQATVQRWYADPILDNAGFDRTLRTVFTHDHFGPSTHQQAGLYAGLLVEPEDSKWQDPVTGVFLGTNLGRPALDGGPTSWQANIITKDPKDSYREFALEFQDRQLAYKRTSKPSPVAYTKYPDPWLTEPATCAPVPVGGWADPAGGTAINAPTNTPGPCFLAPFPSIVTLSFGTGTYSMSYRNEAPAIRVNYNPNVNDSGIPPTADQIDLSHVFRSIPRFDLSLNKQPPTGQQINPACVSAPDAPCFIYPPPQIGAEDLDPYTPLLRAYEGDKVQIRTLVGAHMSAHSFTVHGVNWLFEPTIFNATDNVSGYRGTQGNGISEHYEMLFSLPLTNPPSPPEKTPGADYFYSSSSDRVGLSFGNWGLMRGYRHLQSTLVPLPNNQPPGVAVAPPAAPAICAPGAPPRDYKVAAVFARDVLDGPVVYNSRGKSGQGGKQQIVAWNALAYFLEEDLDPVTGKLLPGKAVEPLVLRANAGDCINVTLTNKLPNRALNAGGTALVFGIPIYTSPEVGLHPQLVAFDVTRSNGVNAGNNPPMTVPVKTGACVYPCPPYPSKPYTWYAGRVEQERGAPPKYIPVEFGSIPLTPSDPLMQHPFGLIGSLIIEPAGSDWQPDSNSRASANICQGACTGSNLLFREFVLMVQDDNQRFALSDQAGPIIETDPTKKPLPNTPLANSPPALNYRTEPLDYRYQNDDWLDNLNSKSPLGVSRALSNSLVGADPQTPVFAAAKNTPLRFRMIHPAGLTEQVFTLHGHVWQEEPYIDGSKKIGNNPLSQNQGSRDGFGPNIAFDAVIEKAGGAAGVTGDYLYRTFIGSNFQTGIWGLLRVGNSDVVTITKFSRSPGAGGKVLIAGVNTVNPNNGQMARQVTIFNTTGGTRVELGRVDVDPMTGVWPKGGKPFLAPSGVKSIVVTSDEQGEVSISNYIRQPGEVTAPLTQAERRAQKPRDRRQNELELFNPTPQGLEKLIEASGTGVGQLTISGSDGKQTRVAGNAFTVAPGETIVVSVKDGNYHLTFPDGAAAKRFFHFEIGGSPFSMRRNKTAIGTSQLGPGSVLATLTVRKDIPSTLTRLNFFFTSEEGKRIEATFVITK